MTEETTKNGHGGPRANSGRPKGSLGRRSREAIELVAERFPDWTPLMYFAEVANDETLDPEIRLDASKAAAPYIHPRLKPIEINPEALVDLERDIAAARLEGAGKALNNNPGLADRLLRAQMRADDAVVVYSPVVVEAVKTPVGRAVADPEPEPAVEVADDENSALGPSRADPEPDPIYIPVMPLPKATAFSGGWPAEPPQVDYDPLDDER